MSVTETHATDSDLVQWLRKLLHSDLRRNILSLADQAVVSGTRFAVTLIVGRVCGPDQLGVYSLGFTFVMLLGCVLEALIMTPYAVFANRAIGSRKTDYAGSVLIQYGLLSLVAMVGLAILASVISPGMAELAPVIWTLAGILPLILLQEFARRFAFAHLRIQTAFLLDSLVAVVTVFGLLALASTGELTPAGAFGVMGIGCGLIVSVWLFQSRRQFSPRRKEISADTKKHWQFGRWVFANQMTMFARGYAVPWLLVLVLDTATTGIFVACETLVLLGNPILLGISNVLTPTASRAYAQEGSVGARRVIGQAQLWLAVIVGMLFIGLLLFGSRAVTFLYGNQFGGQQLLIAILGLAMVAEAFSIPLESGLCAVERPHVGFVAGFAGLIVTLTVTAILVVPFGMVGAACGLPAGRFVALSIQSIAFWLRPRLEKPMLHCALASEQE